MIRVPFNRPFATREEIAAIRIPAGKNPAGRFCFGVQKTSNAQHPTLESETACCSRRSACHAEAAKAGEPSMCSESLLG